MILWFYLRAPDGSPGSGSGLKDLRRLVYSLKSYLIDWESRTSNSGPLGTNQALGTTQVVYPQHHDGSQKCLYFASVKIVHGVIFSVNGLQGFSFIDQI